ncbi:MAG TPA: cupin domain-containing protein [Mycobacteriales bacterium]|nr:cupin domain-containing protein [Mycobacteriales bacterium]
MDLPCFTEDFLTAAGNEFLTEGLSEKIVSANIGAARAEELLNWSQLSELLSTRPLQPPRLRLHRDGTAIPENTYAQPGTIAGAPVLLVRPEALYRELREGASLVLDAIDRLHPPIRSAADDLMRMVRERVQVNLYLLWGETHGFDVHWDDHDTFIVQVYGSKDWTIHGPGRPYPMKTDSDHDHGPPSAIAWKGTLRPGDVMHVPRGWWHYVQGTGEVSLHLTFGFTRATGIDWARAVLDRLYEQETFRRDLPRSGRSAERNRALVDGLAQAAAELDVETFLADRDRRFPQRHRFSLPWPVSGGTAGRAELAGVLPPAIRPEGSTLIVEAMGKRFRFAAAAGPVLEMLVERRSVAVAELVRETGLAEADVDAVLQVLAQQNLVLLG